MSLKEGYYILEDKEGFVFQEYDGGYYFLECFKGEGFYYHSEESDYFQAGQSLYDKAHGLQTLDAELQRLTLDANNSGKVDEALGSGGKVAQGLYGDCDRLGLRVHKQDKEHGLQALDAELQRLTLDVDNSGKVGEAPGSGGKVAQGLHGDFDKPGLHRDFDKLGLRFHKQGQGLYEDFDNLGLRFHKQGQVLEEHCKGFQVPEDRCKGGQALDDDFVDGDSPCLKALEASGVSGRRLFARRV
ncbi:hypothetical protein ACQJBY_056125 [Aegilops geniculata]